MVSWMMGCVQSTNVFSFPPKNIFFQLLDSTPNLSVWCWQVRQSVWLYSLHLLTWGNSSQYVSFNRNIVWWYNILYWKDEYTVWLENYTLGLEIPRKVCSLTSRKSVKPLYLWNLIQDRSSTCVYRGGWVQTGWLLTFLSLVHCSYLKMVKSRTFRRL